MSNHTDIHIRLSKYHPNSLLLKEYKKYLVFPNKKNTKSVIETTNTASDIQ